MTDEEVALIEGLRANQEAGNSGETLDAEEVRILLGLLDRLMPSLGPSKDLEKPTS